MTNSRREFLKLLGAAGAAGIASPGAAHATSGRRVPGDEWGMLTDLTLCIGCRKCEYACKEANDLPNQLLETYEDASVFERTRRPDADNLTVVNRYPQGPDNGDPVYVKTQCMHCREPACASACPVAAIRKTPEGPVIYEPARCMGCRYCIMACPFSMPAYTYDHPTAPVVRKCVMCAQRVQEGEVPACAGICPVEAITFGKRDKLLALARERIRTQPDRYGDHIYGEHEAGGTCWLYLAPTSFAELGFPADVGAKAYPELTAGFLSVVPLVISMWPIVLLGLYGVTGHRQETAADTPAQHSPSQAAGPGEAKLQSEQTRKGV